MDTKPFSYHCPKCKSLGQKVVFQTLPELRQHVLNVHINHEVPSSSPTPSNSDSDYVTSLSKEMSAFKARDYKAGLSDSEELAQAKKYLLKEALKSTEQGRNQIKLLNDEIKAKELNLSDTTSRLSSLNERNQSIEREYGRMEEQNRVIREELEGLKGKLMEKEEMLEKKNKELTEQINYIKSLEGKETLAKEKLERTVQKIIERAEKAEHDLQLMQQKMKEVENNNNNNNNTAKMANESPLQSRMQQGTRQEMFDNVDNGKELQTVLASCNSASNTTHERTTTNDIHLLNSILLPPNHPIDPKNPQNFTQNPTQPSPLAQLYLKSFLERYQELRSKDFAFEQAIGSQLSPNLGQNPPIYPNNPNNPTYSNSPNPNYPNSSFSTKNAPLGGYSYTQKPPILAQNVPELEKSGVTKRQPVFQDLEEEEEDGINTNNNNNNLVYKHKNKNTYLKNKISNNKMNTTTTTTTTTPNTNNNINNKNNNNSNNNNALKDYYYYSYDYDEEKYGYPNYDINGYDGEAYVDKNINKNNNNNKNNNRNNNRDNNRDNNKNNNENNKNKKAYFYADESTDDAAISERRRQKVKSSSINNLSVIKNNNNNNKNSNNNKLNYNDSISNDRNNNRDNNRNNNINNRNNNINNRNNNIPNNINNNSRSVDSHNKNDPLYSSANNLLAISEDGRKDGFVDDRRLRRERENGVPSKGDNKNNNRNNNNINNDNNDNNNSINPIKNKNNNNDSDLIKNRNNNNDNRMSRRRGDKYRDYFDDDDDDDDDDVTNQYSYRYYSDSKS